MPLNQAPATAISASAGRTREAVLARRPESADAFAMAAEVGKPPDDRWAELITEICTSHFYYHQIVC
jgi:hypothetical protein